MVREEEKRLGVGGKEFTARHNEIMEMADEIRRRNKENAFTGTANTCKGAKPNLENKVCKEYNTPSARCKEGKLHE